MKRHWGSVWTSQALTYTFLGVVRTRGGPIGNRRRSQGNRVKYAFIKAHRRVRADALHVGADAGGGRPGEIHLRRPGPALQSHRLEGKRRNIQLRRRRQFALILLGESPVTCCGGASRNSSRLRFCLVSLRTVQACDIERWGVAARIEAQWRHPFETFEISWIVYTPN